MTHVLHLVKDPRNRTALAVIAAQAADPSVRLSIVLTQAAVDLREPLPGEVYLLGEPHSASPSPHRVITPDDLLDLVFAADTIVSW